MSLDHARDDRPRVVVYSSALTDIRQVEAMLEEAGLPFELEMMTMRASGQRQRFRELKASTGHGTLPQIFVDGGFLGGEPELRRFLAERAAETAAPARATAAPGEPPARELQSTAGAPGSDHPQESARASAPAAAWQSVPGARGGPAGTEAQAQDADAGAGAASAADRPGGWTLLLGYAGLIPFAATTGMLLAGYRPSFATTGLLAYGAVIFTFVGAVHWGFALAGGTAHRGRALVTSVLPSLVAWLSLLLPGAVSALALQMAGFLVWHGWERITAFLPPAYLSLRLQLTSVAVALQAIAVYALLAG